MFMDAWYSINTFNFVSDGLRELRMLLMQEMSGPLYV
jgi:hypothetical protein